LLIGDLLKSEIQSSKIETISKIINSNFKNFLNLGHLVFGFVSSFGIRNSYFITSKCLGLFNNKYFGKHMEAEEQEQMEWNCF
jgi:hypothetical protein